ncbi:hypothetical protein BD414DRAFT_233830 [Trametes punicea]|nr:hypothetical protein BD414DRAFT_233830 [Trametes punicea]
MAAPASSSSVPLPLAMAIADHSVTVRGSPGFKRPPPRAQPLSGKAQQRLIRQAVIKAELEAEEREALKMTPEELKILQDSVASVKAEFSDLDGLSWDTPAARELLEQWHAEQAALQRSHSPYSIGGVPLRRSKAPCALSFPTSPPTDLTPVVPSTEDTADDDTVCLPRCANSRRSSSSSTVVPDREDQRTPLPSLLTSLKDQENEGRRSPECRSSLPKCHSAPHISFSNPFNEMESIDLTMTHSSSGSQLSRRTTKALPPSRIPILRSKSLSTKPSTHILALAAPTVSSSAKDSPVRRAVSLNVKRVDPRAVLTESLIRNGTTSPQLVSVSPPKWSVAASGLAASPRHAPGSPASPRRANNGKKNKFRIVSAPPPVTIPTLPPASSSVASTSRVVSGPSSARPTAISSSRHHATEERQPGRAVVGDSPVRTSHSRPSIVSLISSGSSPTPHNSPVLTGKRVRDRHDESLPSPSPTRNRVRAPVGGIPMKRT